MYVSFLHTSKACKHVLAVQNNRCVIAAVCVCDVLFFSRSARLRSTDKGFVIKRADCKSLPLFLSLSTPPGTFSSLYLPSLLPHLFPTSPLSLSLCLPLRILTFPSDLPLFLSQRADFQAGNCMSTGHHTCCCQSQPCGSQRRELRPLASVAPTPSPAPFCCCRV